MLTALSKLPLATVLATLLLTASSRTEGSSVTAIQNVQIVDVITGRVTPSAKILIVGGRISAAGRSVVFPSDARVIDAGGRFAIPGLWDMHVHSVHPSFLQKFVANGVTGIRDMGGGAADATDGCESVKIEVLLRWRDGIRSGDLVGPRMYLSGPAVSNTNWPGSINIKTPAEARDAVARLKAIGADFIKVYEKIPLDAYLELARAAGSADLHIAGHVPVDTVGLIQASNAGHRSVEHIRDHLLMCFTKSRSELLKFFRDDKWEGPDVAWGMDNFKACPEAIKTFEEIRHG